MAEIVQGLFGVSPELFKQQQDAQFRAQALAEAQLSPEQQMYYQKANMGRQLGRAVGGLLGAEDPVLAKQTAENNLLQQVQSSMSPEDMQDPYKLSAAVYQAAMQANMPELANHAYQNLQVAQNQAIAQGKDVSATSKNIAEATKAIREQLDPFARQVIDAGFPKGSAKYLELMSDKIKKDTNIPDSVKRSTQAQMLIDAGFVEGSPEFQEKMKEFLKADLEGTRKGKGNVTIGSIDTGKNAEQFGKNLADQQSLIQGKYDAITAMDDALDYFGKGIYAGGYGPAGKFVAKYTKGAVGDITKVSNTENFLNSISTTVIPLLKEFGGNDSNEELKFLQNVVGGNTELEPDVIEATVKRAKKKIQQGIDRIRKQSESGKIDVGPSEQVIQTPATPKATMRFINGKIQRITQ